MINFYEFLNKKGESNPLAINRQLLTISDASRKYLIVLRVESFLKIAKPALTFLLVLLIVFYH